jgi:arsenate reductase
MDIDRDLLFLCVANSCRSQMAEGLARRLAPAGVGVWSAGSTPTRLNPLAVAVMAEIGVDLGSHRSKGIDEIPVARIGTVITLCAEEICPTFPHPVERLHWPFPDPARAGGRTPAEFRRVRDAIASALEEHFGVSRR